MGMLVSPYRHAPSGPVMSGGYRYYHVQLIPIGDGSSAAKSFSKIEVRQSAGGADISSLATVSAVGASSGTAANAVDGNPATSLSLFPNGYLTLNFGSGNAPPLAEVAAANNTTNTDTPNGIRVFGSTTGLEADFVSLWEGPLHPIGWTSASQTRAVTRPTVTGNVPFNAADKHANISLRYVDKLAIKNFDNNLQSVRTLAGVAHTNSLYCEFAVVEAGPTSIDMLVGVSRSTLPLTGHVGQTADGWGYYQHTGDKYTNNVGASYGGAWGNNGDRVGMAMKNGSLWFRLNGVWQNGGDPAAGTGAAFTGLTGTLYPTASLYRVAAPTQQLLLCSSASECAAAAPTGFNYLER